MLMLLVFLSGEDYLPLLGYIFQNLAINFKVSIVHKGKIKTQLRMNKYLHHKFMEKTI